MLFGKSTKEIDVTENINIIENSVYQELKVHGFRKYGRTLHRFVSGDISQVINFQCGQAYRGETHLMWVNIGIRVPESVERSFDCSEPKKYYHEYECNIRSRLGAIKKKNAKKEKTYDLRKDIKIITGEIMDELLHDVLPAFDVLSSRQAILDYRRDYPYFDILNSHLILLEESMIYGHLGDITKAKEVFEHYYAQVSINCIDHGHIDYLDELAVKLGIRE